MTRSTFLALAACAAILPHRLRAARGPVIMQKPRLLSLQLVPLWDDADKIQSLHAIGTYEVWALNPDGVTRTRHIRNIDVDLIQDASHTVNVGDEVVQLGAQTEEVLILAEAIWLHRFPSRLPEERKAKRVQKQLPPKQ